MRKKVPLEAMRKKNRLKSSSAKSMPAEMILSFRDVQHPPPLTLSVGSWQIREEDLPLYLGVAAGVVLLILLVLAVTTWRCINSGTGAGALRRQRSNTKKENGA